MEHYGGSQILKGLANYCGLQVDQMNFVVSQLVALGLGSFYRTVLDPSNTSPALRHAFGMMIGLWVGYFCFGYQALHLFGLPAICYLTMVTQSPQNLHYMVLVISMLYLSYIHLYRQTYYYGSYTLDISGPLMVITQKVTSLAFSLHDGIVKKNEDLTESQKYHALSKIPSLLEYFGYTLMFPTVMAGPCIFYKDYVNFIEGTKAKKVQGKSNSQITVLEPTPVKAVCTKLVMATICAFIFICFLPKFHIKRVKEDNFLEGTTFSYKFWFVSVSTTLVRFKYYFAWLLAEAICNNSGLGYNEETDKWDKFSNVDIFQFEFATSLKQSIEAWNKGTNRWLRMIVYERTPHYSTLLTYVLSALWHGFYPGYYITFLNGALFTYASRTMRRTLRGYFIESRETKLLYDVMTFMVTRFVLAYITFPFVLLEFWPCIRLYNKLYWSLHVVAAVSVFVIPKVISRPPTPRSSQEVSQKSSIANALRQAGQISTEVGRKSQ